MFFGRSKIIVICGAIGAITSNALRHDEHQMPDELSHPPVLLTAPTQTVAASGAFHNAFNLGSGMFPMGA